MKNFRTWGKQPYKVAIVHGGPGTPGAVAPVARELAENTGVLEPLQTKDSIDGQVEELVDVLKKLGDIPVVLIGHSWGASLSYITAARYPDLVRKLILISTPALEIKDHPEYAPVWLSRLPLKERVELVSLQEFVWNGKEGDKSEAMRKLFRLIARAESYDQLPLKDEVLEYQLGINISVGQEFIEMLESKELLNLGRNIKCPVTAIHGDYDLRPASAVNKLLLQIIQDFKFMLLEKCGHYPWMERYARDQFYGILREEVSHGITGSE